MVRFFRMEDAIVLDVIGSKSFAGILKTYYNTFFLEFLEILLRIHLLSALDLPNPIPPIQSFLQLMVIPPFEMFVLL